MQSTDTYRGAETTGGPVRDEASQTARTAADETKDVARAARDEGRQLADQAKAEAGHVAEEARAQLREQASEQTHRATDLLRRLGDQANALAEGRPEEAGALADYAESAGERLRSAAQRVEEQGLDGLVEDTKRFARERPALFLGAAAIGGFALGRLLRGGGEARKERRDRGEITGEPNPRAGIRPAGGHASNEEVAER